MDTLCVLVDTLYVFMDTLYTHVDTLYVFMDTLYLLVDTLYAITVSYSTKSGHVGCTILKVTLAYVIIRPIYMYKFMCSQYVNLHSRTSIQLSQSSLMFIHCIFLLAESPII